MILTYSNSPFWLVILLPLVVGTICGLWNGLLVSYGKIQPMVATLILMISGRGIAQLITNSQKIQIFYKPFVFIGHGWIILPFSFYIVAILFVLAWLLSRRTSIGLFIESVGVNARSSLFSGINEKMVKLFAYVFCGFCAGVAGIIDTSNISTSDASNLGIEPGIGCHPGSCDRRNLTRNRRKVFFDGQRYWWISHAGCHHYHVCRWCKCKFPFSGQRCCRHLAYPPLFTTGSRVYS